MISAILEQTIQRAFALANEYHHELVTLEHLLHALCDDPDAQSVFMIYDIAMEDLKNELSYFLTNHLNNISYLEPSEPPQPTASFQRVLQRASIHIQSTGQNTINGANVLVSLFAEKESHAVFFLHEFGLTRLSVIHALSNPLPPFESTPDSSESSRSQEGRISERNKKKSRSYLDTYCTNLNKECESHKIDPLIGRNREITRTIQILCRRTKNNPLFVGEPGVGKTAIAQGLAYRIIHKDIPDILSNKIIYSLDLGALVAGTRYRGDFEERLTNIMQELDKIPNALLFIDEIHMLIGTGSTTGGSMDASNLLKPALAGGKLRCIGATTYKEYKQYFEKDPALTRRFQKIDVEEPTEEEAFLILKGLKPHYEAHHHIRYTDPALRHAVTLSARYIHERKLPDKAIDVIDEAGAAQQILPERKRKKTIHIKDIEEIIAHIAHIPSHTVTQDDKDALQALPQKLEAAVFGQEKAISALSSTILLSRAGLRAKEKPLGSYLFTGPTGVGKTEIARKLAEILNIKLLRFDMSEYMERHSVSRLIGTPPGYVGFEQGGLLTDSVDQNPYSVLLLDEIEKANPDLFNLLLQVMDHGKLTDHNGKIISFRNVIIIMTSNAGASELSKEAIGFGRLERSGEDEEALKRLFTPEFRNRLDAIIPFSPLSPKIMLSVVEKFITELKNMLAEKHITLSISKDAYDWLAEHGYDRLNGARPLHRLIEEKIKHPLAHEILFGELKKGGEVKVTLKKKELFLSYKTL